VFRVPPSGGIFDYCKIPPEGGTLNACFPVLDSLSTSSLRKLHDPALGLKRCGNPVAWFDDPSEQIAV
jgi:hypothetical protein